MKLESSLLARDPPLVRLKRRLGPLLNIPWVNALRGVPMPGVTGEAAQVAIGRMVVEGGRLIARVGENEGRIVAWYLAKRLALADGSLPYVRSTSENLKLLGGFFPTTDEAIDRLARLYLESIKTIDLYAAWTPHDRQLCPPHAQKCRLIDIEPFFTERRWPLTWGGMRVTIVSPFKTTIMRQWERRQALFARPVLADCELNVVQAPQTQCEVDVSAQDWFANLERLDAMVAATAPQVVVIGAGAYGLPLGARAKSRGASAVVMGGATQLLFGIMGNRWEIHPAYRALMTDAWTRPGSEERPPGFQNFETPGGAYW